jgi:hypothetical protein
MQSVKRQARNRIGLEHFSPGSARRHDQSRCFATASSRHAPRNIVMTPDFPGKVQIVFTPEDQIERHEIDMFRRFNSVTI